MNMEGNGFHHKKCCVDVHTHLTDSVFGNVTIEDVIKRAKERQVQAAVVVTESKSDFEPVLQLYSKYSKFVLPCLGIHPIQSSGIQDEGGIDVKRSVVVEDYEDVEAQVEASLEIIGGIGEIGLDFTPRFCKTGEDKETQRLVFSQQVMLAQKYDLPVNVHSRSAGKHAIQLLRELEARNVLLHAFDGRASVAMDGASHGFYFSVTASVCRDPQVQKMVKLLPIDRLMVETDSPAIAPIKGATNEPANVLISCEHISKIKNISLDDVKTITTENALKVFPKLKNCLTDSDNVVL